MTACGVEHAGQHSQCGSDEVHQSISSRSDCRFALDTERALDTSGKSKAHRHHRENYTARARKPAAGLFHAGERILQEIGFNLSDFTRRAYGTNYVETQRLTINANCRLRRIYFADRLYSEDELPPEFKLYLPITSKT